MNKSPMTNLNRLLARQNFKDMNEMQAFLDNLKGKSLYDLPEMELSPEEQAQDLVHEAFSLTPAKAKKNIEKALSLDPNCIEAYEYLASREKKPEKVLEMLEKGIAIGRKMFGGEFLENNKDAFWGIRETRPFMRCLQQKADILVMIGKVSEGAAIMEELLELNEGDNQGVRFPLLSALIILGETEKFKKYDKMFADDKYSASILYSRALFAFKTEGNSANARKKIKNAFEKNPFVVQKLIDENFHPTGVRGYTLGSPEEAELYVMYGLIAWATTDGAVEWMLETVMKFIKKKIIKITNNSE